METVQKVLEPTQDAILNLVKLTAKLTGEDQNAANVILGEMRQSEKVLRDRLFVLQVWRKYDYETADKMARKKAGEYDDPDLAKVLEEKQKKEDKAKAEREKMKLMPTANRFKRTRPFSLPYGRAGPPAFGGGYWPNTNQTRSFSGGYGGSGGFGGPNFRGRGRPNADQRGDDKCHNCGEKGHYYQECPNRSNFNNFLNARAFVFWDAKLFNNVNLIFKCKLKNKTFESSEGLCQILSKYQKYDFVVQGPYSHQLNLRKNNTQILSIL